MTRFFVRRSPDRGARFFRFAPADGVEVWTGEKWNDADSFLERVFTDPDFTEVEASALPAEATTEA